MLFKTFRNINRVLFLLMFVSVVVAWFLSNALISFLAVGFYMAIISFLKILVKEPLADEREVQVSSQAAQASFNILMPILLFTSLILLVGGGQEQFHYLDSLGIILSYITCLGLVIYLIARFYYNRV